MFFLIQVNKSDNSQQTYKIMITYTKRRSKINFIVTSFVFSLKNKNILVLGEVMNKTWKGLSFVTISIFSIPISLQPDGVNLFYFKHSFLSDRIHSLKYLRSTILSCKDIGIRKSELRAKTKFLLCFTEIWHVFICGDLFRTAILVCCC